MDSSHAPDVDRWYSDSALVKQAEVERKTAAGEPITIGDMCGIYEARTQPTEAERCVCCGTDARERCGGNGTHCYICIGRGHHEDEHA